MFYTLLTLTGSLLAHQYALKTEKGAGRVGAHQNLASFTAEEGKMIRERVLFVDTGDGMGTFTLDEIGQLKTLIAHTEVTIPEENAEIVNESSPDGIRTGTITSDEAVSEVIREGYLPKDVMYPSIPITLPDATGYSVTGNDNTRCNRLGTSDISGLSIPGIQGQGAKL
jgi:hypothetical protein